MLYMIVELCRLIFPWPTSSYCKGFCSTHPLSYHHRILISSGLNFFSTQALAVHLDRTSPMCEKHCFCTFLLSLVLRISNGRNWRKGSRLAFRNHDLYALPSFFLFSRVEPPPLASIPCAHLSMFGSWLFWFLSFWHFSGLRT
ncbi:hypothetical protein BU16DRAFT_315634 [Lophium mytilinum]|uniref:Uncharacterized protein n=1 Tax=Lophium mytilinum TaxID=390894 RepID=A0A6A6QZ30_9PEZI|nr:hypothetical protein BU16DRAFT_315634 [Lophium mytilinum]